MTRSKHSVDPLTTWSIVLTVALLGILIWAICVRGPTLLSMSNVLLPAVLIAATFAPKRVRVIAGWIFLAFSVLDVLGALLIIPTALTSSVPFRHTWLMNSVLGILIFRPGM